jgi:hypothetical protein
VSLDLLDISAYYGEAGFTKLQDYSVYQMADSYLNFPEKYALAQKTGITVYESYQEGFGSIIPNRVIVFYGTLESTYN